MASARYEIFIYKKTEKETGWKHSWASLPLQTAVLLQELEEYCIAPPSDIHFKGLNSKIVLKSSDWLCF